MAIARGSELGRYLVLAELGAGGMGVVLSAYDPQLDRRVALKLVRPELCRGAAAGEARARLQREAQAMARFSHPNVVTVFDVGAMGEQLFVAMEFVAGDLADWLEREARRWQEVVRTFVEAGRGLAAAHAAGLVHRDFKPANVLVGDDLRPRVSDFGLVAAFEEEPGVRQAPADAALDLTVSAGARVLGTPAYMAPEQFQGAPVDAATDQFAFCVALYEALYRARPFGGQTTDELAHNVMQGRIEAPPETDTPEWLWPVLERGLATQPRARHESMGELLDALENDPEAIARRYIVLDAMIDFGRSRWEEGDLVAADEILSDALADASGLGDRRRAAHCHIALAQVASAQGQLDAASDRLAWSEELLEEVDDDEGLRARVHQARGHVAYRRGAYVEARRSFEQARAVYASLVGSESLEVAEVNMLLGEAWRADGKPEEGLVDLERALEVTLAARGTMSRLAASVLDTLAGTLQDLGRFDEAIARYEEALAMRRSLLGEGHHLTADSYIHLGQILLVQSRYEEAAEQLEAGLAIAERVLGPENTTTRAALNNLGGVHLKRGDVEKAWDMFQRALAIAERLFGPDHPEVAATINNLGSLYWETAKHEQALEHYERARAIREAALGPDHPLVVDSLANIAGCYLELGRVDEGLALFEHALEATKARRGEDHPTVAYGHINVASALTQVTRHDEAEPHLLRAKELLEKTFGPDHETLVLVHSLLGDVHFSREDLAGAIPHYQRAVDLNESLGRSEHVVIHTVRNLSHCLVKEGRHAEAIPYVDKAVAFMEPLGPSVLLAILYGQLAAALWDGGGDRQRAEKLARDARKILVAAGPQAAEMVPYVDEWMTERGLAIDDG
jgi:tetratricopeptide (TPR) repeat protein